MMGKPKVDNNRWGTYTIGGVIRIPGGNTTKEYGPVVDIGSINRETVEIGE